MDRLSVPSLKSSTTCGKMQESVESITQYFQQLVMDEQLAAFVTQTCVASKCQLFATYDVHAHYIKQCMLPLSVATCVGIPFNSI